MTNPYYKDEALEAYHKRNQTGLYGDAIKSQGDIVETIKPDTANLTATGKAANLGVSPEASAAQFAGAVASGQGVERAALNTAGSAAGTALGTAVAGPLGGAVGGALGGAAGNAVLGGPADQTAPPIQGATGAPAQFIPAGGEQQELQNPFYARGTDNVMGIPTPGPMSMQHTSPDTFVNGQIASVHYPNLMGGTQTVTGYEMGAENVYASPTAGYYEGGTEKVEDQEGLKKYGGPSAYPNYFNALITGGIDPNKTAMGELRKHWADLYGTESYLSQLVGTPENYNDGTMMAGQSPMAGPMGTPNFGYVPSGPTRQEVHADMAAAGKENREMMKFQGAERRAEEMHALKMQEATAMGKVKLENARKGPMAR